MHVEALPDETARILRKASSIDCFSQFTLIGGTALALHAAHRLSEDLNFVVHGAMPRDTIRALVERLAAKATPQMITSQAARIEAENDGLDIDDSHQDWNVDGVKVTFFTPYQATERKVYEECAFSELGSVRVLGEEGVFRLKSNVVFERTTTRDIFDPGGSRSMAEGR